MISRQAMNDLASFASQLWRKKHKEMLSHFGTEGDDGLFQVIAAYTDVESADPAVIEAMNSDSINPDRTFMDAAMLSYDRAFATLWSRGALQRLIVVEFPDGGEELDRWAKNVLAAANPKELATLPPPPPEDPIDVCVRDYHEMGSNAFKGKWVNNTKNRHYYEAAIGAGRI